MIRSFAPIQRAALFFGFMALAVSGLTVGAGFQRDADQSSAAVAQAKLDRGIVPDTQLASVDPAGRVTGTAQRAIGGTREARLVENRTVLR